MWMKLSLDGTVNYPIFDNYIQFSNPAAPILLDAWTNEDRYFAGPSTDGFLKVHGYMTSV